MATSTRIAPLAHGSRVWQQLASKKKKKKKKNKSKYQSKRRNGMARGVNRKLVKNGNENRQNGGSVAIKSDGSGNGGIISNNQRKTISGNISVWRGIIMAWHQRGGGSKIMASAKKNGGSKMAQQHENR
jgi:hypothetical protein